MCILSGCLQSGLNGFPLHVGLHPMTRHDKAYGSCWRYHLGGARQLIGAENELGSEISRPSRLLSHASLHRPRPSSAYHKSRPSCRRSKATGGRRSGRPKPDPMRRRRAPLPNTPLMVGPDALSSARSVHDLEYGIATLAAGHSDKKLNRLQPVLNAASG